jgi:hypothetical protein
MIDIFERVFFLFDFKINFYYTTKVFCFLNIICLTLIEKVIFSKKIEYTNHEPHFSLILGSFE